MKEAFLPPVSVVIPNFNGVELLRKNLPPVLSMLDAYPGGGELIVVDDGSSDGSVAFLETQPRVRLLCHGSNRGFSLAVHSGVAAASHRHVLLLNSDVVPEINLLGPLIQHFRESVVFAVSPLIYDEKARVYASSLNCYAIRGARLKRIGKEWTEGRLIQPRPSLYASGGSMLVDKTKFEELGGFLPIYHPFYWEDFDLGVRAWRRGWIVLLEPSVSVVHEQQSTIAKYFARARVRRMLQRNKILVEWIHLPWAALAFRFVPFLLLRGIGRTLAGNIGFWWALGEAVARIPQVRQIRASLREQGAVDFSLVLDEINRTNQRCVREDSEV